MAARSEREKIAHLLRRFALGASEAEIDYYGQGGLKGAIDKLLDYESVDENFGVTLSAFQQQNNGRVNIRGVQAWWVLRLLTTRRPLQEKMTLFWHDHFATSASKVNAPLMMYQQNELFRRNATGKFPVLLEEASKDPAMLFWLDNQFNVRGRANENFAREVMELFTLGIGHYSEKDIQEASRAFTGWSIRRLPQRDTMQMGDQYRQAEYVFRRPQYDAGEKSVLGKTGALTGEEVLSHLCELPRTAIYISQKLWEWFAYPNPEPSIVDRIANRLRDSGLDIKAALRAIMETPEFYSEKAFRAVYKNPVDFCIPTLRQLGVGETTMQLIQQAPADAPQGPRRFMGAVAALQQTMDAMGMELLFPPDVAGWDGGQAWISTATMVERIQWADRVFGVANEGAARGVRQRAQIRFGAFPLFASDPSPEAVAKKLVSLFDAPIPEEKMPQLVAAAEKESGGRVTQQNANKTAAAVTRLIFGAPEFQMA